MEIEIMNTKKMIELAGENDRLLELYGKRWDEEHKICNPVCFALWVKKARIYGWTAFLFLATLAGIGFANDTVIMGIIPFALMFGCILIALSEMKAYRSTRAFCATITMIESEAGEFGERNWEDPDNIARIGARMLKETAGEVKELQGFAWRKKEAEKLRSQLALHHKNMIGIAPIDRDWTAFFKN
jgi:hypothetical protein